jgi:hypothetical protein
MHPDATHHDSKLHAIHSHANTQPDVKATILPTAIISVASHHAASIGPIFSLEL